MGWWIGKKIGKRDEINEDLKSEDEVDGVKGLGWGWSL